MRGEEYEDDYEPADKKCPVCGERFNTRLSGAYDSAEQIIGVPDDATIHTHESITYIHK